MHRRTAWCLAALAAAFSLAGCPLDKVPEPNAAPAAAR